MASPKNMDMENQPTARSSVIDQGTQQESLASHSRVASSVNDLSVHAFSPQDDRLVSDDMGSEIVQLIVGPEKEIFAVHKELLLATGTIFGEAFHPEKNTKKRITMSKESPEIFKLFLEMVYTRQVPAVRPNMSESKKARRLIGLCKLYVFAEEMQLIDMIKNQIFDKIQDGFLLLQQLPEASLISSVYSHTLTSSKFRKFISACMVFQIRSTPDSDLKTIIQALKSNDDLIHDVLLMVHDFVPGQDPRIRSPAGHPGYIEYKDESNHYNDDGRIPGVWPCTFHVHVDADGVELSRDKISCHLWRK